MSKRKDKPLKDRSNMDKILFEQIRDEIIKYSTNDSLSCVAAFEIAENLKISPSEVGMAADMMGIKLIQCQLGLFGYTPEKKIVKSISFFHLLPKNEVKTDLIQVLKQAIQKTLVDGRLSCSGAWEIASRLKINRLAVSGACEEAGIRIKSCQLGAF